MNRSSTSVLISGASVAGPACAYWLARYGFRVTIVEQATAVREGGYPIDLRGTAIDVAARMGILPFIRVANVDTETLTFVDADGRHIVSLAPEDLSGGDSVNHFELPRGVLTSILYDLTRDNAVTFKFGDSIETLIDNGTSVDVTFRSGSRGCFDVVIGADGIHSNTRALAFGPEAPFTRYLGFCFNVFSMPNDLGLSHEAVVCSEPGRSAGVYAVGDSPMLYAFLNFSTNEVSVRSRIGSDEQRRRTATVFRGGGWEIPRLVAAFERASDLYFDSATQIRMPRWSSGRVVLIGDAAYAPSFLTGQGTSLALVGAYVLAGELASHANPTEAFSRFESMARPFVEANQDLASGSGLMLRTQAEIDKRNAMLIEMKERGSTSSDSAQTSIAHNALQLPDYCEMLRHV